MRAHLWLLDLIEQRLKDDELELGREAVEHWLATGEALLLLDGLDEVAQGRLRDEVFAIVAAVLTEWPGCRLVVTSRPIDTDRLVDLGFRRTTIEPFGVHEAGFTVELGDDGDARFFRPDGRPFPEAPPAPRWAGPALEPTSAHLAAAGITIDGDTATPDWYGERLDLPWAIQVLRPPGPSVPAGNNVPAGIAPGDAMEHARRT